MAAKEATVGRVMLRLIGALAVLIAWAVLAKAQTQAFDLEHDGQSRTYRLFLPAGYAAGQAIPLVLNLHGRGSDGREQELYTGMSALADTAGFAVCYPDGLGQEWNVGWSFGTRTDDLGFLTRLIDTLHARYGFDESRTYACGMSNGGFMSYVLACERPGRIAAIASVTGGMLRTRRERCAPALPVPVMQIHGTADPVVRYDGNASVNEPIEDTVEGWAQLDGCDATPTSTPVPDAAQDGFTTERLTYGSCEGGAEVQLLRVEGGGHTWPGARIDVGGTTQDFSATAEVWGFLRRFRRGGASSLDDAEAEAASLEVWPNPVHGAGRLSLKPVGRARALDVCDARGRLLRRVELSANASRLNLGPMAPGVYFLIDRDGGASARVTVE